MEVEVPSIVKAAGLRTPLDESAPTPRGEGHGVKEDFVEGVGGWGDGDYYLIAGPVVFRHGIAQCINVALLGPVEPVFAGWQWTCRNRCERPSFCKQVRVPPCLHHQVVAIRRLIQPARLAQYQEIASNVDLCPGGALLMQFGGRIAGQIVE